MEVSSQRHSPAALPPGKEAQVPIGQDTVWASELVWTLWRRKKFVGSAGNRNPAVQSAVFIPSELSRLTNT
jgi:hypothetical protein